jgi:hypothetical protein
MQMEADPTKNSPSFLCLALGNQHIHISFTLRDASLTAQEEGGNSNSLIQGQVLKPVAISASTS